MITQYQSGEALTRNDLALIADALPPTAAAVILGSSTFGDFRPGYSDVDLICWDGTDSPIPPLVLPSGSEVKFTVVDAEFAAYDPGFGRTLEAHRLVTGSLIDVIGNRSSALHLARPTFEQLFSRRVLELQMVTGWISKEASSKRDSENWFPQRKLVLRATKIEGRLRGLDLYNNNEAERRAAAHAPFEPTDHFLTNHLLWLRASLLDLVKSHASADV